MYGKKDSLYGQNTLVFEIYPSNINDLVDGFASTLACCGLGLDQLDEYWMSIIVCNVGRKTLYYAKNLHTTIHAGISCANATDYITFMLEKGYKICNPQIFSSTERNILIVGSDESVVLPDLFTVYNYGSPEFTSEHDAFFMELDLPGYGKSLLKARDKKKLVSQHTSRGQPMVLNLSYSIQNCLNISTVPGVNLPKLTA